MKTYQEFMQLVEQIPHMTPTPASLARSKDIRIASRMQRANVSGKLAHTADTERQAKRNLDQFA